LQVNLGLSVVYKLNNYGIPSRVLRMRNSTIKIPIQLCLYLGLGLSIHCGTAHAQFGTVNEWLIPFTKSTNYMSREGFLRRQDFLDTGKRTLKTEVIKYSNDVFSFSLAFSPDGKLLANRNDNGVEIWDVQNKKFRQFLYAPGGWQASVTFTSDGKYLIAAGGRTRHYTSKDVTYQNAQGEVRIWDAGTGSLLQVLWAHPRPITSAYPSKDGSIIITAGGERTFQIWDRGNLQSHRTLGNRDPIILSSSLKARFSPDSLSMATADNDGGVSLWDIDSGKVTHRLDTLGPFAFSSDGKWFATSGTYEEPRDSKTPQLRDAHTGRLYSRLEGHSMVIGDVAFSPNNKWLVCSGWQNDRNGTTIMGQIAVWDVDSTKLQYVRKVHKDHVPAVAVSPDSKIIAVGLQRGYIRLIHADTGELIDVLEHTVRVN
jgi:WD40 repeat protein